MTDLRAALTAACERASHDDSCDVMLAWGDDGVCNCPVAAIRSLASAPLTVLDALLDPEVRAGRVVIETAMTDGPTTLTRQWRVVDGKRIQFRMSLNRAKGWIGTWRTHESFDGAWPFDLSDLDAPCRLVPAEGGGE